jgi:predicted SAM-dependent methyltransferase
MKLFSKLRLYRWYKTGKWKIKKQVKQKFLSGKLKIILGSGTTRYEGWISTDLPHFNILKEDDWNYFFSTNSIDNLLAEHVLEHLKTEEVKQVIYSAHKFLKTRGCFRIAVPDAYHPDSNYRKNVAPPADGHQSYWNVDTLQKVLVETGFQTEPLEYYTSDGKFSGKKLNPENGLIIRSRMMGHKDPELQNYSSLIIDSYKTK